MARKVQIVTAVPVPPPVHGSNLMNQLVVETISNAEGFKVEHLDVQFSRSLLDIGSLGISKIINQFLEILRLGRRLLFLRPEVTYLAPAVADMGAVRDGALVLLAKLFSKDVVVHIHGRGLSRTNRSTLSKALFRFVYSGTRAIHLSDGLAQSIEGVADWKSITSVPNGVVDSHLNSQALESSRSRKNLLFLSNLIESKGIGDFIEVCSRLTQWGVDYHARIIGGARPELSVETLRERIAERGLASDVTVIGPAYGDDKDKIIAESDLFLFPSFYPNECCPLVVLEALAAGLPVLAYDIGALNEMVESGTSGYITESRDIEGLSSRTRELLEDQDKLEEMSRAAREHYETNFTVGKFQQRILAYFEKLNPDVLCETGSSIETGAIAGTRKSYK